MSSRLRILPHYTYDDYIHWEGRWEVIEGIPFAMSPSPSAQHQFIANEIGFFLRNQLRGGECPCRVYQPFDLKIKEDVIVQPDLLVVCKDINLAFLDFPPHIVVEILSPSTRVRDQNTKFDLYEEFGVAYYLMVDPENKEIFLYQLADSGRYEEVIIDQPIVLKKACHISFMGLADLLFAHGQTQDTRH